MKKERKIYQSVMVEFNTPIVSRFVALFLTLQKSHNIALNHAYNSIAYAMKRKGLEKMPISLPTLQKYLYSHPKKVNTITLRKIEEFFEVGQKYFGVEMEFEPMKHLTIRAKHNYPKNRKSRYDNKIAN